MVRTRRQDQSFEHEREIRAYRAYRKRMKEKTPLTRQSRRILEGSLTTSSSSSSDASDSEHAAEGLSEPSSSYSSDFDNSEFTTIGKLRSSARNDQRFSGRTTRRSLQSGSTSTYSRKIYEDDSGDSSSSETRILTEAGRLNCTPRNEKISIPLESVPSDVSKKYNSPGRKSRRSLVLVKKTPAAKDLVSSDDSSTEERRTFVEKEPVKDPGSESISPKRKLPDRIIRTPNRYKLFDTPESSSRTTRRSISAETPSSSNQTVTRRSLIQNQTIEEKSMPRSSSGDQRITRNTPVLKEANEKTLVNFYTKTLSISSGSPIQNITPQKNSATEQSGSEDRTVTRSISSQKKPSETISNESQVEITPQKSDFHTQNFQISLMRSPSASNLRPRQSKKTTRIISPIAKSNDIYQSITEIDTISKAVEEHVDIEDLLRQLEGSSDSEDEINKKRSPVKRKRKTSSKKIRQKKKTIDKSKESSLNEEDIHSEKKDKQNKTDDGPCVRYDKYVTNIRKNNISKSLCDNAPQCDICKQFFHSLPVLKRHIRMIHENKKDFECIVCAKKFARLDYLRNHERLLHSENPHFTCSYCNKNFKYNHSRNIHEMGHTGEKPFKCGICGAKFARKDYYKKHRLQHDLKRAKFICDECDKPFVDKFSLQIHIQHHMKMKQNADNEDYQVEVVQLFINEDWD